MFKKKPVAILSHSQQLDAVQNFASTIGDVMAICSVSAKRKGEKLKKRFVVILKEKGAREDGQRDLIFMNFKLSDAKPQLCKKRFRLADISKLTANDVTDGALAAATAASARHHQTSPPVAALRCIPTRTS